MSKEHHEKKEQAHHEAPHDEHHVSSGSSERRFFEKGYFVFLLFLAFTIIFTVVFYAHKSAAITNYNEYNQASPAVSNYGSPQKPLDIFTKYGAAMGIGLGVIFLIISYIIYGITALASKSRFSTTITGLITYGFLFVFGTELVFLESRNSTVGNAIIAFLGFPMFIAGLIVTLTVIGLLALQILKK